MVPTGSARGQATQLGLVLVFGMLVALLTVNQAVLVPAQNEKVDFRQSKEVQEDFVGLQSAVVAAAGGSPPTPVTVDLGRNYPTRQLAVNARPPSGRLYTGDPQPFVVRNTTGGATDVTGRVCPGNATTRSLVYQPFYAEYDRAPTVVYENTVSMDAYDSGERLALTDQHLVDDGRLSLVPLSGNFSRAGQGAASLNPARRTVTGATVRNPEVVLPTRLSESDWESLLSGEVAPGNVSVANGHLTVSLSGARRVSCARVGVGSAGGTADPAAGDTAVNPAGPNAVELTGTALGANTSNVTLSFANNGADDRTMYQARLAFFTDDRADDPTRAVVDGATNTTLPLRDGLRPLAAPVSVTAGGSAAVELRFDGPAKSDVFVLSVVFGDGQRARYRVQVPGASE